MHPLWVAAGSGCACVSPLGAAAAANSRQQLYSGITTNPRVLLNDQGATRVETIQKCVDGQLVDTHRYIRTSNRMKLPSLIKLAERHREIVDRKDLKLIQPLALIPQSEPTILLLN